MCTETFLRLPEEKRNRILSAAWEEFMAVPFAAASINRIVRHAGIPRGSFYQYFDDKADMFSCLMEEVRGWVLQSFHNLLEESEGDLFRTTLSFYDKLTECRSDAPMERFIRVLRINPGIDLEFMIRGKPEPEEYIIPEFLRKMDLSRMRRQDKTFLLCVCRLAGISLAGAIMDSLCRPGQGSRIREELAQSLEIIRQGSEYQGSEQQNSGYQGNKLQGSEQQNSESPDSKQPCDSTQGGSLQ